MSISLTIVPTLARLNMLQFDFVRNAEDWRCYDYELDLLTRNGGVKADWSRDRGVSNGPFISSDDSKWTIDTPERPPSILPLMTPTGVIPLATDLRNAEVSVYLRGDNLNLYGGECLFWIKERSARHRWHMSSKPLKISDGAWGSRLTFILENDERLWHFSWDRTGTDDVARRRLDIALANVENIGFSFVHFHRSLGGPKGVTGKFSIAHLAIRKP